MSIELFFELLNSSWQTIYMVILSGLIAFIAGIPLGIILLITRSDNLLPNKLLHRSLGLLVNVVRSIPFIILMVAVIPFTRLLMGTSIGTTAAIVPLSLAAIPFVARMIENALSEVAEGLIEAGHAMGATSLQIIRSILLPEAMPGVINCVTITLINLIAYSAMAGAIGGGGLGDLAIRYGYQRFNMPVMLATIIVLVLMVQLLQHVGNWLSLRYSHR